MQDGIFQFMSHWEYFCISALSAGTRSQTASSRSDNIFHGSLGAEVVQTRPLALW